MNIRSAKFVKGLRLGDEMWENLKPHIAFVGRSNVGKSSLINSLTNQKDLARTSSFPGRTQEINLFLINNTYYFVDLPGYGFAKLSLEDQKRLQHLIYWYLFTSSFKQQKIVLIIDAEVGLTEKDLDMVYSLEEHKKNFVIVANKIDKIKKSEYQKKLHQIHVQVGIHKVIPYSSKDRIGKNELLKELLHS